MNEQEYLAARAAKARAGMSRALGASKQHVKDGVDPKQLTRRRPLLAVIGAAVMGLVTALFVVPRKRRLAAADAGRPARSSAVGRQALRLALRYGKPMLVSTLTSALSGVVAGKKAGEAAASDGTDPPADGPLSSGDAATGRR